MLQYTQLLSFIIS